MSKHFFKPLTGRLIGLTGLCFATLVSQMSYADDYKVEINKTQIMRLPSPASAIVVGNPAIADVSVHSPTMLFVNGRGYGVTNVIILDELGNVMMDTNIQVSKSQSASGKRVLMAGRGWQSYACTPFCQPAPVLGDDPKFLGEFKGEDAGINNTGTPISPSPYPTPGSNPGALSSTFINDNTAYAPSGFPAPANPFAAGAQQPSSGPPTQY